MHNNILDGLEQYKKSGLGTLMYNLSNVYFDVFYHCFNELVSTILKTYCYKTYVLLWSSVHFA